MYKLCKSEQSTLRQQGLEQELLEMMKTVPFDEIMVSDLCSRAGISRKVFYRYFSSKKGALYALIDHTLQELDSFPSDRMLSGRDVYHQQMTWLFQFWQRQEPLLTVLEASGISELLTQRLVVFISSKPDIMGPSLARGDVQMQEYIINFAVSGIMSMVFLWHRSGYLLSPEQIAEIAVDLLTQPMVPVVTNR